MQVQAIPLEVNTEYTIYESGFSDKLNSRVWIDWNRDGDFTDEGEEVGKWNMHPPGTSVSVEIVVPMDAVNGLTRMRVYTDMPEVDAHDPPNPCGYKNSSSTIGHHGEVEDYDLMISGATEVDENLIPDPSINLYPNPVTSSTCLAFSLQTTEKVTILICDAAGKEIKTILNENLNEGAHAISFDMENMEPGFYLIRLQYGNENTYIHRFSVVSQ